MKESQFVRIICNSLPKTIHQQSMTGTENGTPDRYIDARPDVADFGKRTSDLWLEFKVLNHMPADGKVRLAPLPGRKTAQGHLTVLQMRWITRRWENGRNAFVIVGLPERKALIVEGNYIYQPLSVDRAVPFNEVTAWILGFCGG